MGRSAVVGTAFETAMSFEEPKMNRDNLSELIEEMTALAGEYPDQPEWQGLLDRIRAECGVPDETCAELSTSAEPLPPAPDPSPCCLCDAAPALDVQGLCGDCAAMYSTISARVIPDTCDCGHAATGTKAYRYRKGGTEETLCGLDCVRAHFRKVFRLFLGRTR